MPRKFAVTLVVALGILTLGPLPQASANPACALPKTVLASNLDRASNCSLLGHVIQVADLEVPVPGPGTNIAVSASRSAGATGPSLVRVHSTSDGLVALSIDGAKATGNSSAATKVDEDLARIRELTKTDTSLSAAQRQMAAVPSWCGQTSQYVRTGQKFQNETFSWFYNSASQPSSSASTIIDTGQTAMETDSSSCGTWSNDFKGGRVGSTTRSAGSQDSQNVISWGSLSSSTLALSYWWYSGSYTTEADTRYNASKSWYVGTGSITSGRYDLYSVAAHESGHVFGLNHVSSTPKQIMYPSFTTGENRRVKRAGDLYGLWRIS